TRRRARRGAEAPLERNRDVTPATPARAILIEGGRDEAKDGANHAPGPPLRIRLLGRGTRLLRLGPRLARRRGCRPAARPRGGPRAEPRAPAAGPRSSGDERRRGGSRRLRDDGDPPGESRRRGPGARAPARHQSEPPARLGHWSAPSPAPHLARGVPVGARPA